MKPYRTEDGSRNELVIQPGLPGCAAVSVINKRADMSCLAEVAPEDVPAAALALYEAAGLPAPLILERPKHTGGVEYAGAGDRYAFTSRAGAKVAIGWHGIEPAQLDPNEALEFAAHIAVNALAIKEGEPDPAEVDELAEMIGQGHGLEKARDQARRILLAGWKREPGR